MEIITTTRHHFTVTRMAKMKLKQALKSVRTMQINWKPQVLLAVMYNGVATVEKKLAVPQKVKHSITIPPS